MALVDFFAGDGFRTRTLTEAINIIPNTYGRTTELGLFTPKPIATTGALVEYKNGVLNLLQSSRRGGNGATVAVPPKRLARTIETIHIEHDDFITADDIQNIRRFGEENMLANLQSEVADRMEAMTAKHDITLEHLQMGALKGQILDADGTVLLDLFSEFGITQTSFAFNFSNANADIPALVVTIKRFYEKNAFGETITGLRILCSPEFMDSLTAHASVKALYDKYASEQEPNRNDVRNEFRLKGVTFEEYVGEANNLNSDNSVTVRRFIPAGGAIVVPLGTRQLFRTYFAPADFLSEVNKQGQTRYAKMLPDPSGKDKFVVLHTQQNPRPNLLVRFTST